MNPNKPVLIKPTRGAGKKDLLKVLLKNQVAIQEYLMAWSSFREELVREIYSLRESISQEVDKQLGHRVELIEAAINESILQKEILIEKGFMTREDINRKWKELVEK